MTKVNRCVRSGVGKRERLSKSSFSDHYPHSGNPTAKLSGAHFNALSGWRKSERESEKDWNYHNKPISIKTTTTGARSNKVSLNSSPKPGPGYLVRWLAGWLAVLS